MRGGGETKFLKGWRKEKTKIVSYLYEKLIDMEIDLGKYNLLEVVKEVDFGVYLDGGDDGEILLPSRYVPSNCKVGERLNVFIYLDQDERLIATTQKPLAEVGQFAYLKVAWVNQFGAFLDWGLMKDLFVPFREQKQPMQKGCKYLVHVHVDEESYRIMASAKVEHFLSKEMPEYEAGESVDILVGQKTDLGYKAIIENRFGGLLYRAEIFRPIETGMRMKAFIKQVREDGKIDLALQPDGYRKVDDFAQILRRYLSAHGGYTELNDKSDVRDIYETFGVSKKTFKKAVGELYRKRLVVLEEQGIRLARE